MPGRKWFGVHPKLLTFRSFASSKHPKPLGFACRNERKAGDVSGRSGLARLLMASVFFFGWAILPAQESFVLSGTLSDAQSGETLIGATVYVPDWQRGTLSNEYGFYSIKLPARDSVLVQFSYVGFQTKSFTVYLEEDTRLDVELGVGVELAEVVVKADSYKEQLNSTDMSVEAISTHEAKLVPVLLGESDILKTLQLKPGIPSGSEGSTGLFVRGGASDQNLIILDEAVVYNAAHLFGFFSTFNTDAVKDLKLYKGGFPAQYGGRLSSVIDIKLNEGNNKEFSGKGGIGLISSRLTLEGPIQKGKSSFMISGRRTYFDLITRAINKSNEDKPDAFRIPDYYFYDLNAKVNTKLSEKDRLYFSGYFGRDVFNFSTDFFNFVFDWGNATGTVRWNHIFSSRLFSNTTFTFSNYKYNISNEITGFTFDVGSNIRDVHVKNDSYLALNEKHTLRFGGALTYHLFEVGRLKAGSTDGEIAFSAGQTYDALEGGLYFSDEWHAGSRWLVKGGLRLSAFFNDGAFYHGLEPRLNVRYKATDKLSFKASYALMSQYMHLVSTSGVSLPTDIWYPSTEQVLPQRSQQLAAGFSYLLGGSYFLKNEYYYKRFSNQLSFVDGAELFVNDRLEEEFAVGKGYSYGAELGVEKKEGKLTGWVGYTLSLIRVGAFEPLYPGNYFSQGRAYFSPRYDRRHDLSVVLMYEFNRRFTATLTYVYGSGDLTWLPTGRFTFQDVAGGEFHPIVPVYQERNNYRLPSYQRLDLGLIIHFFPKWGENDLTINVINALDRRNTFFLYLEPQYAAEQEGQPLNIPDRIVAKQVSLFPILPSVTWNFSF